MPKYMNRNQTRANLMGKMNLPPRRLRKGHIFITHIVPLPGSCLGLEGAPLYDGIDTKRVAWTLAGNDPIGTKKVVNTCDTPDCVNPVHLALSP